MSVEHETVTGDAVSMDWTPQGGGDNYVEVDNLIGSADDSTYISVESSGAVDTYDVGNPTLDGGTCTSIRVGIRGMKGASGDITVRIYDGPQIGGDKTVTLPNEPSYGDVWTSAWTGLSLSAANLTDLLVEVEDPNNSSPQYISGIDVEFTYTAGGVEINIGDDFKAYSEIKINIGDDWKDVTEMKINIGDDWKDIF